MQIWSGWVKKQIIFAYFTGVFNEANLSMRKTVSNSRRHMIEKAGSYPYFVQLLMNHDKHSKNKLLKQGKHFGVTFFVHTVRPIQ